MTADTATGDDGQTIAELRRLLAEREAERDAAMVREAAMAEVVALINASPADPQPVFDAILEKAHRLLGASIGTLWTYDGAYIRGVATHGHPEDVASYIRAERWPPVESVDRLIKGERFFQVQDLRVIYYESGTVMRLLADRSAVRTMLLVPLRKNGQFIGHITAFRTEVRPYAEPEIALLERFAAQAVIAIENARLLGTLRQQTDDLRESLDYQTAISDVLRVISRSTFDLGPVLETLLSAAARLCDADLGGIATVEGDGVRVAAHYSRDGSYRSTTLGQLLPLTRSSILGRTALEGRVIHVEDVGADPEHVSPDANTPRVTGTMLGVPLLRDGIVLGSIRLARATVKPFTQRQIDLVSTFADQAVIAIENARLLGALRERTDELAERNDAFAERIDHQAATIDVLEAMSASPDDPQPVFDLIADQARTLCGGVHVGLFEFDGTLVHCRAAVFADSSPDVVAAYRASFPMPADQDPDLAFATTIREGRTIHIRDTAIDPGISAAGIRAGLRSAIAVPLLRDGVVIGLVSLARYEVGGFSDSQVELLKTFAEQAVIAITSAETYRALQTRTADLREALDYQTATSDVLQVISRSAFDLQPALDTLLATAARLCEADNGFVLEREGDVFRAKATFGIGPREAAHLQALSLTMDRTTVTARAALEGRVVQVADVTADPDYNFAATVSVARNRTILGVPLMRQGVVAGVITLCRHHVRPFTDQQIALVSTFADQAVIAIENTRLLTETREALEQQTATAEVLRAINANPGDLTPVFDAVLEKALRLCGASIGGIHTYNGDQFEPSVFRGVTPEFAEFAGSQPFTARPGAPLDKALRTRQPAQEADLMDTDRYRTNHPYTHALVHRGGIRALLHVPLLKDGEVTGAISIFRGEPGAFTGKQVTLLENFAAQAVIAMENARLLTETREALEQQTATAEVLQVINASPGDLAPVFDAILEKSLHLAESAFGIIFLHDNDTVRAVASRAVPAALKQYYAERQPPRASTYPPARRLRETKRGYQLLDLREGPNYRAGVPGPRAVAELGGARSLMDVPLIKDQEVIGNILIYRQEVRAFTDKHIALLENFAAQAVIAMENARLLTETREALERQTAIAEILQVINASAGDLQPVFDTILEKALILCNSAFGTLHTVDSDTYHMVAKHSLPPALNEHFSRPLTVQRGTTIARVMRGEDVVHVADLADDDAYRSGVPSRVAMVDLGGARTQLLVSLRKDNKLLGVINIFRTEVRPYSEKQISLLQAFAAQATIAMENARLITETRKALEQQTATAEVLQVINANPGDLTPVFEAMLGKAMTLGEADFGLLRSFDGERAHPLASRGLPAAFAATVTRRTVVPQGPLMQSLNIGLPVQTLDVKELDLYKNGELAPLVDLGGARTVLNVPLVRDQAAVGYFTFYRQEVRAFTDKQIALMQNFASQAVIAMENARLLGELRSVLETTQATLRDLKIAQANLIQAEKMASLGQLTAGIAHEIKNPLNFVNNFAALSVDLLAEFKETAEPGLAHLTDDQRADLDDVSAMLTTNLRKIEEHGKRADGIVRAMLEHSRGSSGERREVDLNALVEEALNLAYHGARARDQSFNITLERDYAEGIAPIEVNPQDLTRVFLNLFSNGFYAAGKRAQTNPDLAYAPTLLVATREAGDMMEVRVRDNGTGIPPDIRDKLFQPFFTTKPTGEGTGLGLSITHDIVTKQHGGTISVDSEVGAFTEFTVSLPKHMFGPGGHAQ